MSIPRSSLSQLIQVFRLVWAACRYWTLAWILLLIGQGLLPVVTVYLTKILVDSLVQGMQLQEVSQALPLVIKPAAAMVSVLLLTEFLQGVLGWVRTIQAELVRDHISILVQRQSVALDLAFYEMPDYHDQLHRARSEASGRSLKILESWGALLQNGLTFLAMSTVLISYAVWLVLVLIIGTLPAFYLVLIFNRQYHRWWQKTTSERRWADYYDTFLTHKGVAAELRLFDLGHHFQTAFQTIRSQLRQQRFQLLKRQSLATLGVSLAGLGVAAAAAAWMFWRVLQGQLTLGDLALFYQAFDRSQTLMRSLLGSASEIHQSNLFLDNLFEFLTLDAQVTDPPDPHPAPSRIEQGIRFREVSFAYPGSDRLVLENFNLFIPAHRVVAIVGDNGAGKSTLIKLLCRFYDPSSGQVEVEGIDLRQFASKNLRRLITVLFQSPVPYQATVANTIALGDLTVDATTDRIQAAAYAAGADSVIDRLPQGYETLLGKTFVKGTELSGGEWQRVALARAFFRQAPIIILDEPTSAMDSWAESEWMDRFHRLAQGKTVLLITHRLLLAKRADVIHVMKQGQIVESGSHPELMARGGFYAQSWASQLQEPERVYA